ncbi:MAG: hypothetical protein IJU48_05200 [Synergistaceae bacterium]|nr:hypothetical protein [Synergistaceae bacterium]
MASYTTRYSNYSNYQLNALYTTQNWNNLSSEERLDALQELANRSAEDLGNTPCEVILEDMNGSEYGYQLGGRIYVNRSLVQDGKLNYMDDKGNIIQSYTPKDTNAQLMDTIHHENFHAYQIEAIEGKISHDDTRELQTWTANDAYYIDSGTFYRIQSIESSAFNHGEDKTKSAFEELSIEFGEDQGYQEYLNSIDANSYDAALAKAQDETGDENIQQTLDDSMISAYIEDFGGFDFDEDTASSEEGDGDGDSM